MIRMTPWMMIAGLAACAGTPDPATVRVPAAASPTQPSGLLGPDGVHVATERVYQGDCSPPGSRGGCHTLTLRPDGTYRNFLFDAAIPGTYRIDGTTVTLTSTDTAMTEQLTLSPDGTTLGTLTLVR